MRPALQVHLEALGFDRVVGRRLGCSQCEALAINGHPTHETGCPNAKHECKGCDMLLPCGQLWCEDCQ